MSKPAKPVLQDLPIEQLQRGRYQPRKQFDPGSLKELADSIKSQGLIQPIVVCPLGGNEYEIIAGERRWRAAQIANMSTVPCLVRLLTDEQAAAVTTIENIQRQDLNPIEEAHSYQRLIDEFYYHHDEVAAIVGKSRAYISNALRLLKLDKTVQQCLIDRELSIAHGKIIAGLPAISQAVFAQQCVEKGWSVRQTEREVKKFLSDDPSKLKKKDVELVRFERLTSEHFAAEVKMENESDQQKGWMKIRYYDLATLAGLLDKMGVDYE